ncbi:MAG: V-type ATP synthase subunit C [Tissierellia bacterium]|nr:V-type ATP synthase subunit C [Tissierellia bacterium]
MDRQDYIHASTRIRVFEKRLLKAQQLQRLVQAGDEKTFLQYIQESDYGKDLQNVQRPEDFHRAMDANWLFNLKEVMEMSKDKEVIELLAAKYIYHNYKVLVKETILGQTLDNLILELPNMDVEMIRNRLAREDQRDLPSPIVQALADYEETGDAQRIDLILDRSYFQEMLKKAQDLGEETFINFVRLSIDFSNAKALVRLKAQGLEYEALDDIYTPGGKIEKEAFKRLYKEEPAVIYENLGREISDSTLKKAKGLYESTGSLAAVEKLMEDSLMDYIRERRWVTYGPEVLFGYLLAKEREIMNLRMIYTSLIAGIEPEKIEERLRDSYV